MAAGNDPVYPGLIPAAPDLTPEQVAELRRELGQALRGRPVRWIHPDGKARRRLPLPWRVRARLRARRAVDGACAWLCCHGREDAALRIWQALGMVPRG